MVDLRLDSSSDSESACSVTSSESFATVAVDSHGRPLVKPKYSSIGVSSVLSRAREFLPIFRDATVKLNEPKILDLNSEPELRIPGRSSDPLDIEDDASSESSFGVEVDLGLGVFDVNGPVNEESLKLNGVAVLQGSYGECQAPGLNSHLIQEVDNS